MVFAMPIGVGVALFLNESGSAWIKNPLAVLVDLLAAIPSVVYGLWGLFVLVPLFDHTVEPWLSASVGKVPLVGGLFRYQGTSAGRIPANVSLNIRPIVTAVTREVVSVVSTDTREGAMALGATRYETIRLGVLPTARPGIVGAGMLGLGRALGETIAVALVIGNSTNISASLFKSG
jgi:phosphate transport system permease protein